MENHQQPVDFSSGFAHHEQYNANITGLPLVSGQNAHGIAGTGYDPVNDTSLPLVDSEISPKIPVQQPQYDPNEADLPVDAAPNSPPIIAENFHADASADMATFIDQIMGRAPSSVFSFSDNSVLRADAFMNAATPPLFMPPETNTTFMDNTPQNGNFQTLMDNHTQTAPLYDVAQATANRINSSGQSPSFTSNYFFPVNDMVRQPSMFASNPSPTWQESAPGNQFGRYLPPPSMFNPQAYNSFLPDASTALIRPQQPSPGNQLMNVNPPMPGTSLPVMSQFSSPNVNPVMIGNSLPMISQFNSLNTGPMRPESSLPGCSVAFNPMNTSPMMPGTYTLPVSATNARPVASFGNPGKRVTFGPGMSARIELGHSAFTSNAPHSSPSGSSSGGTSTAANSRDRNKQISGASSARAGREIFRQDDSGTPPLAASSQQGSRSRLETHQQMIYDEMNFNRVYDPRYAELGLPVDPFLRMFNQHPEFWKKVHGNVDLSKK